MRKSDKLIAAITKLANEPAGEVEKKPELSKAAVEALTVPEGKFDAYIWDPALPSFGVRKTHTGGLSFIVKFTVKGKQRKQSLGKVPLGSATTKHDLARAIRNARNEAQVALAKARLNDDFKAEDRAKAAEEAQAAKADAAEKARLADTIGPRIATYLAERKGELRPRSFEETARALNKHLSILHGLPVTDLRRAVVSAEISRIANESGPVAADRVRAALSTFCSWLIENQVIEHNPCSGIRRKAPKGDGRERVLSMTELAAIWRATAGGNDHDRIARLLMLTGQRREEIGGLMWHEIAASEIRLPGERTKNKRPHTVPLSEPTLSILRSLHRRHNRIYLFGEGEGPFSGWSKSKARLDERIWRDLGGDLYAEFAARLNAAGVSKGRKNERDAAANRVAANLGYASAGALRTSIIPPWTLHDLRRTFSTHCADLGFGDQLTIDLATNHISGRGRISRTYTRAKMERQKRELMEKWGAHIHGLVEATGTESVSAGSATPEPQPITDTQSGPAASPMDRAAAFRYFLGRQRRTKRKSPRRRTQRSSL